MAENLLLGQPAPTAPNQVWVGDITCIAKALALASFSRPGNPYDNAQAEAGWRTLKTELLPHGGAFATLEEAQLEVAYYLHTYFNLDRRHAALSYRSPHQFEHDFQTNLSQPTVRFYWTTPVL